MSNHCRLCEQEKLIQLLDFGLQPIVHHLLDNPSQKNKKYSLSLSFCTSCGLIQINDPISPDILYSNYHSLTSWKNQPHIGSLIEMIQKLPLVHEASILEIGSNDGIFLEALIQNGYRNCLGIDPAEDAVSTANKKGLKTIKAFFNEKLATDFRVQKKTYDLVIARQSFEHIENLISVFKGIQKIINPGGYILIEVPNFDFTLKHHDYSALWEEHINHFTKDTLEYHLNCFGIQIITSGTFLFSGEALVIIGQYTGEKITPKRKYLSELSQSILHFQKHWKTFQKLFIEYIKNINGEVAVYGAGCRASLLINFLEIGPYLKYVLDDQDEKQDKFLPGSGLSIHSGDILDDSSLQICLLAVNAENETKIIKKHTKFQERGGVFQSIHPPSSLLPSFWYDTK